MPLNLPSSIIHGYTGVTLFFVISGYVVTRSFLHELPLLGGGISSKLKAASTNLKVFFLRRIYRILPLAVIWLVIYYLIAQLIKQFGGEYGSDERWTREIIWFLSGFFNYFFAFSRSPGLFGQYWSLFVEMHFYFILPFFLIIVSERKKRISYSLFGIALVIFLFRPNTGVEYAAFLTHTQFDGLLAGVVLYLVAGNNDRFLPRAGAIVERVPNWLKTCFTISLLAVLWWLPYKFGGTSLQKDMYILYCLISFIFVWLAQKNQNWISFQNSTIDRFFVYLGSRSYALYVCHLIFFSGLYPTLMLKITEYYPSLASSDIWLWSQVIFLFLVALLFSELSYRFIEVPFVNLGKQACKNITGHKSQTSTYSKPQTFNETP